MKNSLEKSMGFSHDSFISLEYTAQNFIFNFILNQVYKDLSFRLKLALDPKYMTIRVIFLPLNSNNTYLTIPSNTRRLYAAKDLSVFNKLKPTNFN